MKEVEVIEICEKVLASLAIMGWENVVSSTDESLIFPKIKEDGKFIKRISEQELRQLFIDKFKKEYLEKSKKSYYSIEVPTDAKYSFGDKFEDIKVGDEITKGQSALLDMCVFEKGKKKEEYKRILNIEFKHGNAPLKDIAKDVLKLMHEKKNGAFIFLLDNTNTGSLNNEAVNRNGVLDKLSQSFEAFEKNENYWKENDKKYIQLIILSLEQKTDNTGIPFLIHRNIRKDDLGTEFSIDDIKSVVISKEPLEGEWGKIII